MKQQRKYTDEQVAYALNTLDLYKQNVSKASRVLEMPRETLSHWAGRIPAHPNPPRRVSPEVMTETRKQLKDQWKDIADASAGVLAKAVEGIGKKIDAGEKITASDVYRLSLAAGISTDKYQLLSGGATSRSETIWDVLVRARPAGELPPASVLAVVESNSKSGSSKSKSKSNSASSASLTADKPYRPVNSTLSGTNDGDIIEGEAFPVADSDTR